MKNVLQLLEARKWEGKYPKYSKVFDTVSIITKVNSPCISVVVIAWKYHPLLLSNLQALSKQKERINFEVIFVDNGGSPGEFSQCGQYIDTWVRLTENTGVCIARNIGAIFASSNILLFLEDDALPDPNLIEAHYFTHLRYAPYVARGVCLPLTSNQLNYRQTWYYLGDKHFPMYANIEGNTSYNSDVFFHIGGWNDDLTYGGEGKELAMRILDYDPERTKQIYSPHCIIFHDYANNEQHLKAKLQRQQESYQILKKRYPDWDDFEGDWHCYLGDEESLQEAAGGIQDLQLQSQYATLTSTIRSRNKDALDAYMHGKAFLFDKEKIVNLSQKNEDKKMCIFGVGSYGTKVYRTLKEYGVQIDCFFDNNSELWNSTREDVKICNPRQLNKDHFIFIASAWYVEISGQLGDIGFQIDEDYLIII
ncbi:MAG: glycosyltransferase family 2 protein [Paenibacillus sp.]|uniref:glycosyltransferase family 2 protein n=1 Tax=Paenibacillus sp. TaxID=58172 RepID=UPI002914299F|nr:glycosyltransferase family 2 protein [Paenibacillus sp.]MDU4695583.1 glycosyltransferase family 2 protein [Paenibacillus sp.]